MNDVRRARASLSTFAAFAFLPSLSSCYWLAQYSDLSSELGDAGVAKADAQPLVEAGPLTEAGPVVEAGTPFCPPDAGPLAYCMDFDGDAASALSFLENSANVGVVETTYVSPLSSLSVSLLVEGDAGSGGYDVSFSLQPKTTRLEFQIQTVGVSEGVTTLAILLVEPATQTTRKLNVVVAQNASFQVQEYVAFADGGSQVVGHDWLRLNANTATAWHHVVLTLTVNDATKQYTSGLSVDDQVFEDGGYPLALPWAEGNASLGIGVTYAASGNQQFYFDNVRADFGL